MLTYHQIFKKAWQIVWQNKFLWFFGFFAALIGNSGGYEMLLNNLTKVFSQENVLLGVKNFFSLVGSPQYLMHFKEKLFSQPSSFVFLALLYLILGAVLLFIFWVIINSVSSLIYGAAQADNNKKISLKSVWTAAKKYFWPVLVVNLLAMIVIWLLAVFFSWPILGLTLAAPSAGKGLLLFLLYLVFAFLSFSWAVIVIFSLAFVILKNKTFGSALSHGLNLFLKNWLISLEMVLLVILISLLAGIGLGIALFILAIPLLMLYFMFSVLGFMFGLKSTLLLGLLILLTAVIVFNAVLTVFQYSSWIILFTSLTSGKFTSAFKRYKQKRK